MGDKNCKKYLRRMAVSSICAIALCLACMVPATLALFAVEVSNNGNIFEVAQFSADSEAVLTRAPLNSEEEPVVIKNGEYCAEGDYQLRVIWKGNTAGHIKVSVAFAAEEKKSILPADYVINLPAYDAADTYELLLPLTLHEDAVITSVSTWGVYEAAEGESTVVLSLDTIAAFEASGGISFGTPFVGTVTLGTDPIGEKVEEAVVYEPGTYELTIDWTPGFAGYCVLDFVTAEEESDTAPAKYIIKLPKVEETEGGENIVIRIPLTLHEKTRITAVTGKGSPDNGKEWPDNGTISFGAQFLASAAIGKEGGEYAELAQEVYQPGVYQLKLDWTKATADGWCKLTVGEDVYYFSCSKSAESRERFLQLELLKEAEITLSTEKGVLPEDISVLADDVDTVVYGAQFDAVAAIGKPDENSETATVYDDLTADPLEAGIYELKLDWGASTADGYCLITVGESVYYLNCSVTAEEKVQIIRLELKDAAKVTVTCTEGAYSGDAIAITEAGIVYELPKTEGEPQSGDSGEQEKPGTDE